MEARQTAHTLIFVDEAGFIEMNCLAKMHVGNAHCVKSFEKVSSVLTDAC